LRCSSALVPGLLRARPFHNVTASNTSGMSVRPRSDAFINAGLQAGASATKTASRFDGFSTFLMLDSETLGVGSSNQPAKPFKTARVQGALGSPA